MVRIPSPTSEGQAFDRNGGDFCNAGVGVAHEEDTVFLASDEFLRKVGSFACGQGQFQLRGVANDAHILATFSNIWLEYERERALQAPFAMWRSLASVPADLDER